MIQEEIFRIEGLHYATGKPVGVEVRNGLIYSISEMVPQAGDADLPWIAPGLIDNQINGYANVDFSGDNLTVQGFSEAAKEIWKTGVTSFMPTLITNSHDKLLRNFRILAEAITGDATLAGSIPGFHLEGPYISSTEGYRGCHPVHYTRKPSLDEFVKYQEAANGRIIQVTLAPELEGAEEFIRALKKQGIVLAMGHTNSSLKDVAMAAESGVTLSTHLGNGCANMIHRHNNPIWPQLAEERLIATIIADGLHLLPEELKVFLKVKGSKGIILTSDVMYLAGMKPGRYTFMESEVMLTEEGMLRNIELNCLAGASFPLRTGVGNMMKFTGCTLREAIDMATANAGRVYDLHDRGVLAEGKRADLILFTISDNQILIKKTYLNGSLVFDS
jgi:N-acetylglucosamine-6-phosphate deacetylase